MVKIVCIIMKFLWYILKCFLSLAYIARPARHYKFPENYTKTKTNKAQIKTRGVAVDLGIHCNIGSKRKCCPFVSNY